MSKFSTNSQALLRGVHPTLVRILSETTLFFDTRVLGGLRTMAEQKEFVRRKLSQTLQSMHLIQADGFGHAVDLAPTPVNFEDMQDSNLTRYQVTCLCMLFYNKGYAKAQGVDLRIGGDWNGNNLWDGAEKANPFLDLDHIELPL